MITSRYVSVLIYAYLIPVVGLLFLLYLIRYNSLFSKKQQKMFMTTAIVNLVLMFFTGWDMIFITGTYPIFAIMRRITSFINFGFGPIIPLMLYKIFRQKKSSIFLYVPFILNIIICAVSMFVELVFFIDLSNKYSRGVLFFVPVLVMVFYLLLILIVPTNLHKQGKKVELMLLTAIMAMMIVAVILESIYTFYCLNYGMTAICLIAYYILKNIHYFKSDLLTSAYNRQMYTQELSRLNKSQNCVIALLDINNFKDINDTYGHEKGDQILKYFVGVLQRNTENISMLYRIGGDEFVIISKKVSMEVLKKAIDDAAIEMSQHQLSFACGIKSYDLNVEIDDFMNEVDKEMYIQKNLMRTEGKIEKTTLP